MKNGLKFLAVILLVFTACKSEKKEEKIVKDSSGKEMYTSYGDRIETTNAISATAMYSKFKNLKKGDTLNVKFASTIKEVCTKKGCWMVLPLGEEKETMVRFKDYGFFMPLDSKNKEVIVSGKGYIKETSVKELQHYAEDAGKSKEEIAQIIEPKQEFAFEANGVLMKK